MRRTLAALLGLCVWWCAAFAAAQDINDIPSPDEIRDADSVGLQVDWPADGAVVKVPFTITGKAEPGARLELWLGGELERKFIADANGRFTTPVSRSKDGAIAIHQVDAAGERLRTTEVNVVLGGEATALPAPEKSEPIEAPPTGEPTGSEVDDDVIDPFAQVPEKTDGGLPKVSDLGGTPSGSASAPVPPPPTSSGAEFAEQPQAASAPEEATTVAEADVEVEPRPNTPSRTARYFAEVGVGLAGAATFGFAGVLLGVGIGLASGDEYVALGLGAVGGIAGWVAGLPAGVVLGGNMMDGNGEWWAVILGELAGFAVAAPLVSAYSQNNFDAFVPALLLGVIPALTAAAGYELTSDPSAWEAKRQGRAQWSPSIGASRDGRATFGFQLTF